MTLSLVQKITDTLQDVGQETQGAIRENTGVTKAELQRLQIGQQIGTLQIQISSIRAEIRALEREGKRSKAANRQLKELRKEEQEYLLQIRQLQSLLSDNKNVQSAPKETKAIKGKSSERSPLAKGCGLGCVTYIVVALACSSVAIPLDLLLFDVSYNGNGDVQGPLFSLAAFVAFFIGMMAFFFGVFPQPKLWEKLSSHVLRGKSKSQRPKD
jgi:hypothetical protein